MKFKLILIIVLISILTIGAVTAADDNQTSDSLTVEENVCDIGLNSSDAKVMGIDESDVLGQDPGTFTELQNEIDICSEDTYMLTNDYNGEGDPISITKSITIEGNGYTLDAQGGRVFEVMADNVIISNLIITNAFTNGSSGAAIHLLGDNCAIINCSIIGSYSGSSGGAIYFNGNNGLIDGIKVINSSSYEGGAVCLNGFNNMISNSEFENCEGHFGGAIAIDGDGNIVDDCIIYQSTAISDGGAIYAEGDGILINESVFKYCNSVNGGAIFVNGSNITLRGSNFSHINAKSYGGSIYFDGDNGVINNINVFNSTSYEGGALYITGYGCKLFNSNFTYNIAEDDGGAIIWRGDGGRIVSVICIGNSGLSLNGSSSKGGAICILSSNFTISDSEFTSNNVTYGEGANSSSIDGGALFIVGNSVTINGTEFSCNYASNGGTLYIIGNGSTIINCTIDKANATCGGAIYVDGDYTYITESNIHNSSAVEGVIRLNGSMTMISNSLFEYCYGGAIYAEGDGILINESVFEYCYSVNGGAISVNGTNATVKSSNFFMAKATQNGGAIYIFGSFATVENSTFNLTSSLGTSEGQGGGAIYIQGDFSDIVGSDFYNSRAYDGAAIYLEGYYSNITDSNIYDGYASRYAGALVIYGGYCSVIRSNFTNNSAYFSGGSIYFGGRYSSRENVVIGCIFINNTAYAMDIDSSRGGGAICFSQGSLNGTIKDSQFINNSVQSKNGCKGGAILWDRCNGGVIDNCIFDGNYLNCELSNMSSVWIQGGAVFIRSVNMVVNNTIFKNCWSIREAGALYASNNAAISSPEYYLILNNLTFINNTALCMGFAPSTIQYNYGGGAILIKEVKNSLVSNCTFINNSGTSYGGGVSIVKSSNNGNIIMDCTFINNDATYGGGLWTDFLGTYLDLFNLTFIDNTAQDGAGIYWDASGANIYNLTFKNNSAIRGGAIFVSQSNTRISGNNFTNNSAQESGGAIYVTSSSASVLGNNFTNNSAQEFGGAIYVNGNNTAISDNNFTANNANYGGAIYSSESSDRLTISHSTFEKNNANYGGAIYVNGSDTIISVNNFIANNANYGGAIYSVYCREIQSCMFTGNVAEIDGGAVYGRNSTLISSSVFTDNVAYRGGAIYNCTYEECSVEGNGSQIYPLSKKIPTIEISVSDISFGENATVNVVLPSDIDGEVTVSISGSMYDVPIINGLGNISFVDLTVGNYTVTVVFEGNDDYFNNSLSMSFSVSRATPDITITANNMKPNGFQTVSVRLPSDATGNVSFCLYKGGKVILNSTCEVSSADGILINGTPLHKGATFNVGSLAIGSYNLTVQYSGDDNYAEIVDYALFTVSPRITINQEVAKGDNIEITVDFGTVSDTSSNMTGGTPSISGNVRVYIDGEEYVSQRISGSKINYLISTEDISLGIHRVTFQYAGSSFDEDIFRYWDNSASQFSTIEYNVNIIPKEIVIPPKLVSNDVGAVVVEMPADSEGTLDIFLDSGEKVATIDLSKYANRTDSYKETIESVMKDCIVTIEKTEGDRMKITMTFAERKGDVGVILDYTGDDKYSSFRKVSTASINHKYPLISGKDLSMVYSSNKAYSVVVYGSNGKVAGGVKVSFFINNKAIGSKTTNGKGVASIVITNAPGSYKITAKALGVSATKKLTIKHVITLKAVKVKRSAKKLVLTATLKKVNGKSVKGKKVIFKFNGKKYNAKTNKKGIAKVTIKKGVLKKLKVGKKVKYQVTYLKDTVKKTAKVKK